MMPRLNVVSVLALCAVAAAVAQTPATPAASSEGSSITVRSNLVVVPALVWNKSNQLVYSLTAEDFVLTDNGVGQKLQLEGICSPSPATYRTAMC